MTNEFTITGINARLTVGLSLLLASLQRMDSESS